MSVWELGALAGMTLAGAGVFFYLFFRGIAEIEKMNRAVQKIVTETQQE